MTETSYPNNSSDEGWEISKLEQEPYIVYDYSIDNLVEVIANKSTNNLRCINEKLHKKYFESYFSSDPKNPGIGAKTFIVENNYVDKDYLEDFAGYYVRCFHNYQRVCSRIHYFSVDFNGEDFNNLLEGKKSNLDDNIFQENYLGFMVVKPLPETVIGRTCLKTYPESSPDKRYFPITRPYEANLFGIKLSVKSLAFQEQDQTVAACATSALWSVFQGTGLLFQHTIPSPVEITKAAAEKLPTSSRILPNHGLTIEMMAHAIQHIGLEPCLVNASNEYLLKSNLYAYLQARMPMILAIELFNNEEEKSLGYHAVAVTGYKLSASSKQSHSNQEYLSLVACNIKKFYVHDDQIGPFARMEFDNITVNINGNELVSLSTSWPGNNGEIGNIRAIPQYLIIPLYHKIRIPFETVHDIILYFNRFLEETKLIEVLNLSATTTLNWDIYLTTVNDLKSEICNLKNTDNKKYFKGILLDPMPRFLWRATAIIQQDERIIDLLFDATDIELGTFFIRAIEYNENFSDGMRVLSEIPEVEGIWGKSPAWKVINWFNNNGHN